MAIAAIETDLEAIASHHGRQPGAPCDAETFQGNALIEQLHARLVAQGATVVDREFACAQDIHPGPQGAHYHEQEQPGTDHPHSVGTLVGSGKPPSRLAPCTDDPVGHIAAGAGTIRRGPHTLGEVMKLVFPGGEHGPVELAAGATSIGSAADCRVVLRGDGVAEHHCEITFEGGSANVRPLDAGVATVLNGRQVPAQTPIKDGDLLVLGRVGVSIVAERKPAAAAKTEPANDDRTRVRAALPRFLLRGVSGATLGKTYAVTDNAVIGRQPDCDLPIPAEEVSRHHARLKVTAEGVLVEDMGSANGTWINDKRVQSGLLKPGEELRLDTVRFLLITPGMDAKQQSAAARPVEAEAKKAAGGSSGMLIVIAVIVLAVVAAALHFAGVF